MVYFFFLILYDPDIILLASWTLYQFYTGKKKKKGIELESQAENLIVGSKEKDLRKHGQHQKNFVFNNSTAGGFFTNWATREAQEYWSELPIPSTADLPDPGIEPESPALQVDSLTAELWEKPH